MYIVKVLLQELKQTHNIQDGGPEVTALCSSGPPAAPTITFLYILFADYRIAISNKEVSQLPSDPSQAFSVCGEFTSGLQHYVDFTCPEEYKGQYVYLIGEPGHIVTSNDIKIFGEVVIYRELFQCVMVRIYGRLS